MLITIRLFLIYEKHNHNNEKQTCFMRRIILKNHEA